MNIIFRCISDLVLIFLFSGEIIEIHFMRKKTCAE